MHRKIKSWLDKFKPGVKFKYKFKNEVFTVTENSEVIFVNEKGNERFFISSCDDGHCNYRSMTIYRLWAASTNKELVTFLRDD